MLALKELKGFEPEIFPAPACGEALWIDGGSLGSQDFEDGCFQTRARRAAQSFGRAALAKSLAPCRVMGLPHKGDRQALDGQLHWIFWPVWDVPRVAAPLVGALDYRSRHNYDYRCLT